MYTLALILSKFLLTFTADALLALLFPVSIRLCTSDGRLPFWGPFLGSSDCLLDLLRLLGSLSSSLDAEFSESELLFRDEVPFLGFSSSEFVSRSLSELSDIFLSYKLFNFLFFRYLKKNY